MDDERNEPWLPPGHAERLTVGARVTIRLSGECPHEQILDGTPGHVLHVLKPGERARYSGGMELDVGGHRYAVVPELPRNAHGAFCWLAAAELEPLPSVLDFGISPDNTPEENMRAWERMIRRVKTR